MNICFVRNKRNDKPSFDLISVSNENIQKIILSFVDEKIQARFKIWEKELPKCSCPAALQPLKIAGTFDRMLTTHVLLPAKCSEQLFLTWSKLFKIPELMMQDEPDGDEMSSGISESLIGITIVTSEWIVDSLKNKMILKPKPYLHQLQSCSILVDCPSASTVACADRSESAIPVSLQSDIHTPPYGPLYNRFKPLKSANNNESNVPPLSSTTSNSSSSSGSSSSNCNSSSNSSSSSSSSSSRTSNVSGNDERADNPYAEIIINSKAFDDIVIPINRNKHITDILQEMTTIYDLLGDDFREMAYNRVCGILQTHPTKILDMNEIIKLPGVGKGFVDKINEILQSGKLEKLESFKKDAKLCALINLARIWGMGPKGARNLYEVGFRNVEEVMDRGAEHLTAQQKIGE